MTDVVPVREAAQLIALALTPGTRPTSLPLYHQLLERALREPVMERAVQEIAAGLGLRVLELSSSGLVLGTLGDSPFAMAARHYLDNMDAEQRVLHGLIQVGLAAYVFPKPEDLEGTSIGRVTVVELDAFIRGACQRLEQPSSVNPDVPTENPELELAWRTYLRWPATGESATGTRNKKTTQTLIKQALDRLVDEGLLRAALDDSYQVLHRYRLQVREMAAHSALRALRAAGTR
jgi:hypothetical protein